MDNPIFYIFSFADECDNLEISHTLPDRHLALLRENNPEERYSMLLPVFRFS